MCKKWAHRNKASSKKKKGARWAINKKIKNLPIKKKWHLEKKKPNSFYDGTEQKKRGLKFFARMDVQKKKNGH